MKRKEPSASATILNLSGCDLSPSSSTSTSEDNNTYFFHFFQQQCNNNGIQMSNIDTLNISKCRLGPVGVSNLFTFLLSSTAAATPSTEQDCTLMLKCIYLQRNAIGSAGMCMFAAISSISFAHNICIFYVLFPSFLLGGRVIGNFLSNCNTHHSLNIEVLDLSLNDIKAGGGEPSAAKVISNALKDNTTLKQLIMEKCALGPDGAKDISNALIHNKTLTILELAGNMIGPTGGEYLFNALRVNSTLQELGLKMNRIGGCSGQSDLKALSSALLSGVCSLTKLDLSYNDVKCSGCTILYSALAKSSTLIELILEKNDINEGGAIVLANALGVNESIEKLVLKGNDIYCAGGGAIGKALKSNVTLRTLDLSSCSIKNIGGGVIGRGLSQSDSLEHLYLDKNALGEGSDFSCEYPLDPTGFFSIGISMCISLKTLSLSRNHIAESGNAEEWGKAIANAIANSATLEYIDLSHNALSVSSIVDAVASHRCIKYFDFSDNDLEFVSIETQLLLAKRMTSLEIDLSLNPLSSPPLGRLANCTNLQNYLTLLSSERTAISRIRLMVLGVGGVGKSTFCRAITTDHNSTDDFQSSLSPVQEWNVDRLADWASRLGTSWSEEAVSLVIDEDITGKDLSKLVDTNGDDSGNFLPSQLLTNLCEKKYPSIDVNAFTKAVSALMSKGYLSTVGVVKVDGTIELEKRKPPVKVELVDFAGQVEFLVSHQLLLSSMHTLCIVIQPAPSFGKPSHRHYGSWGYWTKFLASLGDRRKGSLLLVVSQIDKLEGGVSMASTAGIMDDFLDIKRVSGAITRCGPLLLDYSPRHIIQTIDSIKSDLSKSLDEVSHDWWVPSSYEALADILRGVAKQKASNNELPILTKNEMLHEISAFCDKSPDTSLLLTKMKTDAQLLQRAINYLEAVGDVMQAGDQLLMDPIGWFSNFLSHFIKDDLAVSSIQVDSSALRDQRGIVHLEDIVTALKHEYESPEEHIFEIMELLCRLELCAQVVDSSFPASTSYLFPCLLPSLMITSPSELGDSIMGEYSSTQPAIRGHRFRESSGFIPPGLFVGLLARLYQKLEKGTMHPSTMWKDHAVLVVNKTIHALVRCDVDHATIDVVAFATDNEQLFVGAAKGQASIVIWLAHLIKMYLRNYSALTFEEAWLCPNPMCHGFDDDINVAYEYTGSDFILSPTKSSGTQHDCNVEGCWRFLGSGHNLEPVKLTSQVRICPYPAECSNVCQTCNKEPIFSLRESV